MQFDFSWKLVHSFIGWCGFNQLILGAIVMSAILESFFVAQQWRVNMSCIVLATKKNIFGYVAVTNLEKTIEITACWTISKNYPNSIDDDSWGEAEFDRDEPTLASCNDDEEWEQSDLIDGDGNYVNYCGEALNIIEGTNWRQILSKEPIGAKCY